MAASKIEWTNESWNPTRGCDIYDEACKNCYAMRFAHRFSAPGQNYQALTRLTKAGPVWVGEVREVETMLDAPLKRKKPTKWFVDSMSDLFYGDAADKKRAEQRRQPFRPVSVEFIGRVYEVMARCPQHTFQILTKRTGAMADILHEFDPLPNVLIGTSVGNQDAAAWRRAPMSFLSEIGWRTWVSYEPAIGSVDWSGWDFLRWMVAGEESGYGRRPAFWEWFNRTHEWAAGAGVPFFMKQLLDRKNRKLPFDQFPRELQVREYPAG